MRLDIFFAEDIRNALLAAEEASASTVRVCAAADGDGATLRTYREGYRAALSTVALAFGIPPQSIVGGRAAEMPETQLEIPEEFDVCRGSWQLLENEQYVA